jgi:pimeloyl-ACP methyl ester carboxylesterase
MRLKCAVSIAMSMILAGVSTASTQSTQQPLQSNPMQPKQPPLGPGESAKSSRSAVRIEIPGGAQGGWLFLPSNPAPATAPVVIFCHGFSAILPRGYQAWIDHLVSRGNIVLWPNYQDNLRVPTREFLPNALAGVKAGLHILQTGPDGVHPDLDRVAVVGHSAGGMIAAGIAASAAAEGLPAIKALMPVEPGDSRRGGVTSVTLADLSTLPDDILLLILVGEEDTSVGTFDGERILHESTSVPSGNKALFMLHSDNHGSPALVANHFSPTAVLNADGSFAKDPVRPGVSRNTLDTGVVDALDYMGTWRLLDRLLGSAFSNAPRDQLFKDRSLPLMGKWSDGVAVVPLTRLN